MTELVLLKDVQERIIRSPEEYGSTGGFQALRKALRQMTPEQVTEEF